jgi:molybdenum cofactor cytidylyltransferase
MRKVGGLILAAGGSTRLGQPKQLLDFNGETLAHATVRAAREGGCDPVCAVTGHQRAEVEETVKDLGPRLVHNEDWRQGIGSSIRLGVNAMKEKASALLILVCDQPAVSADLIRLIIRRHEETGLPIVASAYAGTLGIPALFDRACFPELLEIGDSHGAKPLILRDPSRVATVDFPEGEIDLDSPADLENWRRQREIPSG